MRRNKMLHSTEFTQRKYCFASKAIRLGRATFLIKGICRSTENLRLELWNENPKVIAVLDERTTQTR